METVIARDQSAVWGVSLGGMAPRKRLRVRLGVGGNARGGTESTNDRRGASTLEAQTRAPGRAQELGAATQRCSMRRLGGHSHSLAGCHCKLSSLLPLPVWAVLETNLKMNHQRRQVPIPITLANLKSIFTFLVTFQGADSGFKGYNGRRRRHAGSDLAA